MRDAKRRRLEAKGWKFGNAREFLRLSAEEAAYIDLKTRLAIGLRDRRRRRSLTQADLAKRLQSSQSRIAKMEAGDPSVSLDLLVRSLLILGHLASGTVADHLRSLTLPCRIAQKPSLTLCHFANQVAEGAGRANRRRCAGRSCCPR